MVRPSLLAAAVFLGFLGGALPGCHGDTLGLVAGTDYTRQDVDGEPHNDVDLMFVIDNSPGIGPKQQALVAAFPALLRELRAAAGGLPNLRLGVVSSNLGAFGSHLAECDHSDRGLLAVAPVDCAAAPQGRFLTSLDGGSRNNFAGDPSDAFACLVQSLGVEGCGFEQPLAAARRALDLDQPIENEGFLRPGSLLGLLVISDEDDCSAPATTDLFEPSEARYGPQRSFRCNEYGHRCGGNPPPSSATPTPLADCRSAEGNGKLTPVADIARFFQSLVPPERLVVSVIGGPLTPYNVRVDPALGEPEIAPSCQSAAVGGAAPGVRLGQFATTFGARGTFSSVCDDLSAVLGRFGQAIVQQVGAACLMATPIRLNPEAEGGKADCWVTERAAGLGRDVAMPRCDTGVPRPCWNVVPSREHCETSGYELRVERGETAPLPGTVDTVRCRVCTNPGDPRCP